MVSFSISFKKQRFLVYFCSAKSGFPINFLKLFQVFRTKRVFPFRYFKGWNSIHEPNANIYVYLSWKEEQFKKVSCSCCIVLACAATTDWHINIPNISWFLKVSLINTSCRLRNAFLLWDVWHTFCAYWWSDSP